MKLFDFENLSLNESAAGDKLMKDARLSKMVAIHFRHDTTVPGNIKFRLGPKPSDEDIMKEWIKFIDALNTSDTYGVISPNHAYHEWITKVYASGATDWEDISSQFSESVMSLLMLTRRNLIPAEKRDINRYSSMQEVTNYITKFRDQLKTLKGEERLKKITADAAHVVLADTEDYLIVCPMNMGAGIKYGRSVGKFATWCTATDNINSNLWTTYSSRNYLFIFFDKKNENNKYQGSAADGQFMNPGNNYHDQGTFARDYPCAMEELCAGMEAHAAELEACEFPGYKTYNGNGGSVQHTVGLIRTRFANAFGDCAKDEDAGDADHEHGPEEDDEDYHEQERRRVAGDRDDGPLGYAN